MTLVSLQRRVSRPPRIEFAGAVYHVMARGDREEVFRDDRDRSKFLGYLAEGAERYRVKVYCYVLMENHFHLVVMTPEGNSCLRESRSVCAWSD